MQPIQKMSKQVDVKALVSHVVRGDGVNKCRICMGDTSEGQVHLSDTVVMEGDKPVTLSELLEIVTGIQVLIDEALPPGLCTQCSKCAINAAEFKTMCLQTSKKWDTTLQLLYDLPLQRTDKDKIMFAIMNNNEMIVINDEDDLNSNSPAQRLTTHLTKHANEKEDQRTNKCPDCGKRFHHPIMLFNHLKQSTDLKRACHVCGKIMLRDELVYHINKEHNKLPYDCKKCPAMFLTSNQHLQHMTKAHSSGLCSCVECGQTFQTSNAFYAHTSVHRQKSCPSCNKIFRNQTCYLHHIKRCCNLDKPGQDKKQTKITTLDIKNKTSRKCIRVGPRGSADKECICGDCGKTFRKKRYLAAHIQIVHMKNTHRPCIYCGKLLATAHMTEHVKKHEIDYSYTCGHCGIVLKTKLGYIQHLRLHTGERPYACKVCGETFMASSRRSEHMRRIHKEPDIVLKHACKLCPAKFRLPYRLKKHMQSAHVNANGEVFQPFECKQCNEKFGSCRGLLHHSRKHQKVDFPPKKPEKSMMFKVYSEPNSVKIDQKVLEETELPGGLCSNCTDSALLAWRFILLCRNSDEEWERIPRVMANIQDPSLEDTVFFIYCNEHGTVLKDSVGKVHTLTEAANRLSMIGNLNQKRPTVKKKRKLPKVHFKTKCKICGKAFNLPYYLNKHLLTTTIRACTVCGKVLPKEKLRKHLENVHRKFYHYCGICHQLFDDKANYDMHKDLHGLDAFQCRICKHGFKSERSLRAHMYAHTLFNCPSCNTSFENRKCYVYHREHCTGPGQSAEVESNFECHDCGRKYTRKPSLRIHVIQKHLNVLPFVCQICGKRSSTRNHHASHELTHKTERETYQCYCGAKMRTALGFHMHQRIHSGEKPYKCEQCGDRFLSSSRRVDHMKRRHRIGEMAHSCDKCGAKFIRPVELKKHRQSVCTFGGER